VELPHEVTTIMQT